MWQQCYCNKRRQYYMQQPVCDLTAIEYWIIKLLIVIQVVWFSPSRRHGFRRKRKHLKIGWTVRKSQTYPFWLKKGARPSSHTANTEYPLDDWHHHLRQSSKQWGLLESKPEQRKCIRCSHIGHVERGSKPNVFEYILVHSVIFIASTTDQPGSMPSAFEFKHVARLWLELLPTGIRTKLKVITRLYK